MCERGRFGPDCSMSHDKKGRLRRFGREPHQPPATAVSVYVYDMPPRYGSWYLPGSRAFIKQDARLGAFFVLDRLLRSVHLTTDPATADLFFVPIPSYNSMTGDRRQEAMQYVNETWPWFSAHNGTRHFVLALDDTGGCSVNRVKQEVWHNVGFVQYVGLQHPRFPCYHDDKDVVIPDLDFTPFMLATEATRTRKPRDAPEPGVRNTTLFFMGVIFHADEQNGDPAKWAEGINHHRAFGDAVDVRAQAFYHYHDREGYMIVPYQLKTQEWDTFLGSQAAKFCLAPTGMDGHWGRRVTASVILGCVPVVVQNMVQPFEDVLPYDLFSLRVPTDEVAKIHEYIEAVDDAKLRRLQAGLRCVEPRFYWESIFGGVQRGGEVRPDAFSLMLELLAAKVAGPESLRRLRDTLRREVSHCIEREISQAQPRPRAVDIVKHPWMTSADAFSAHFWAWNEGLPAGGMVCSTQTALCDVGLLRREDRAPRARGVTNVEGRARAGLSWWG